MIMNEDIVYIWQKVVGNKSQEIELYKLKEMVKNVFSKEASDNYKQKLVYSLLETIKNNDQRQFFYILLKAINKPKEDYKELWEYLKKNYDVMPDEVFVNFAYSIVLGIMATYSGEKSESS
jgi:hypothetical protein